MGNDGAKTRPQVAIYCRISDDREGRRLGVDQQEEDGRREAERRGYNVASVFVENDLSASTKSRKARPKFEDMMRRAEAGEFDAIIAYSSSRLTRRPLENERLIELGQHHGILIHYVNTNDNDLTTARGRRRARDDAARDIEEAEEIGEKVARRAKQRAERGEWHGGHVPHGYRVEEVVETTAGGRPRIARRLMVDPVTAPLMQEAANRLLSGESLYAIANDFNTRGLLTSKGSPWRSQTIRKAMLSPSIVGMREVREYAKQGGKKVLVSSMLHKGQWEPLIAEKAWNQLRDLLTDPTRKFGPMDGSYAGKRPLGGGLTVCGNVLEDGTTCGRPMVSAIYRGEPRLICGKQATFGCGGVVIKYEPYEQFVLSMVMEAIDGPLWRAENARQEVKTDTRADRLRMERKTLQEELARAERLFLKGHKSETWYDGEHERVTREVASIDKQLQDLTRDTVLDGVETREDAMALWDRAADDPTARRRFLASFIERVEVTPWPKGMPTKLTRRTSEAQARKFGWTTETEAEFNKRVQMHTDEVMRQRVKIVWRR